MSLCSFYFWLTLQEISGNRRRALLFIQQIYYMCFFFTALEKQEFEEPQKWWTGSWATSQTPSRVQRVYYWHHQTHKAPNIDSFRHRPSLVLDWQSKQLYCHSVVFHPTNPLCPIPRPLLAHQQHCFLHVGGPHHFKVPRAGALVGWQTAKAQLSKITLVSTKETHVGELLWLELLLWTKWVTDKYY